VSERDEVTQPEVPAAKEASETDGHSFATTTDFSQVKRCRYCSLYEHDYHMLKRGAGKDEPIPCPYVSEVLPPSDDERVNR